MPNMIERLASPPSLASFKKKYLAHYRPVLFPGAFAEQGLSLLNTKKRAISRIGSMPILLRKEYGRALDETRSFGSATRISELKAYFSRARDDEPPEICSEQPLPRELLALCKDLPEACGYGYPQDHVISQLFVGKKGLLARLHFDGDHAHVLFHQVFGRKRVVLIEPGKGRLFDSFRNLSLLNVGNMSEVEKSRFFHYVDALDFVIHPGETVYIPPLMWHYIEYLDDSMSINLRFGRSPHRRFFGEQLISDFYLQNISRWMPERGPLRGDPKKVFDRIRREWKARTPEEAPATYQERMRLTFRDLYHRYCDPRGPVSWLPEHAATAVKGLFPDPVGR